jgi:hypothetical protein
VVTGAQRGEWPLDERRLAENVVVLLLAGLRRLRRTLAPGLESSRYFAQPVGLLEAHAR